MAEAHDLFNEVTRTSGDRLAGLRAVSERFVLDTRQAVEVMLQAEGKAVSRDDHERRVLQSLLAVLGPRRPDRDPPPTSQT